MSNTSEEPLSDIELKSEATDVLSPDASFPPVSEKFPSSDDIYVPECEADTSDADVSDSDWETIDENAPESKYSESTWDDSDDPVAFMSNRIDPNSAIPAQFMRGMGKMYQKHGKFELAESLFRMAQHELDRIAGRLHEYTLDTVFSLAVVLSHLGKLDEAGKLGRRAIRGYLKVKGPGDATTLRVLREISRAYSAVCRQLLQHDPPADSEERRQVSRHTNMYISICLEVPLSAVSVMLGGLGLVLVLAGHPANANLAFQWKYASLLSEPHDWPVCNMCRQEISSLPLHVCLTCTEIELCSPCYRSFASSNVQEGSEGSTVLDSLSGCRGHEFFEVEKDDSQQVLAGDDLETTDQFNAWLRDAAKELQGKNAGLLSPDPFLIGAEETPAEALSMYLMRLVMNVALQELIAIRLSAENNLMRVGSNAFKTWFQDAIDNFPSWDSFFGVGLSTNAVLAPLARQMIAKTFQDEDLWNSAGEHWKYSLNYPLSEQELPSIKGLAARLMAEARTAKETIPKGSSPPTTSFLVTSDSLYDTLPLNEGGTLIRLLELLPGDTTEPLVCNLIIEDMLNTPVYEAVSYTWGIDASPTHEYVVQVNSVRLQVTPNLHACLLALRYCDASRMLWVDAICINQKDDHEKSEQVARMTRIYSSASNVLVYLGDGGEADEALFRYFNREKKEGESFEETLDKLGLSKPEILKTFAAFCRREWWTRIWIQQEFALSPTDPTFCLGHLRALGLPVILDALVILTGEAIEMEFLSGDGRSSALIQHLRQVVDTLSTRRRFQGDFQDMNTILSMTPQSKCSDPRDIIFGRYIFMKPMLRQVFMPDYSLTTESLFEMVAIWLLKIEIGMELFWFYPSRLSSKSPSWVPDFTKRDPDMKSAFPLKGESEWRAEGQADDPLDIDCGVLKLHARPLDTISHVFRVGDAPLPELAKQIMFLEQSLLMIAEQDPPHCRHFLSEVLPDLKTELCPQQWALGTSQSIYKFFPGGEVFLATVKTGNFVESQFEDSYRLFLSILDHQDHNTLLADHNIRMEELLGEFTDASSELVESFLDFQVLLRREHLTELFWASLCDSRNLIRQIKDLKTPRQSSSPPSQARRHVTDLVNQMVKEIHVPDVPSPMVPENDDTEPLFPASSANYEELQAIIADCEFEEDVQLRARFVVHLAKLYKSSVDADGKWIRPRGQLTDEEEEELALRVDEDMGEDCHERLRHKAMEVPHQTIFITEQRFVGVGRTGVTDIRVGDELIMLENGVFPMVIRPRDLGFHEIVGYADIHGLDGQAFHRLDQGQKPPRRVFKFR
ncbi:hypothetical protein CEP53_008603 [Fusarium sp. AF-6]|nr:hypothetical protein CEP53_008603 [Fusarium sp. AF-6]